MYKIKQVPEDFVVDEVSDIEFNKGNFFCYSLKKKNYTTLKALQTIAKSNNIPLSNFSWAGNKDRQAVTSQLISVKNHKLKKIEFNDFFVDFVGNLDRPVSLGMLKGNNFQITMRNISELPELSKIFINFFGEQRFSVNNVAVGRAIVKGDFEEISEILDLKVVDRNFNVAIRTIPKKMLSFYIHSFQSFIWNLSVKLYMEDNPEYDEFIELPVVGFASENLDKYSKKVMENEKISSRDFIIRQLPDISAEGSFRKVWTETKNLKIGKLEEDELNKDKKKILFEFFLVKGSYATEFIKQNFPDANL